MNLKRKIIRSHNSISKKLKKRMQILHMLCSLTKQIHYKYIKHNLKIHFIQNQLEN